MAVNIHRVPMSKKVVPTNVRPKQKSKDQINSNKKRMHILNQILYWTFTILLAFISGYFFYKKGLSKRDVKPIQDGVNRIELNVSQLRQDILGNTDYKKYLEMYQVLYKSILEKSFPGGYVTLGLRNNAIFNPGNFSSKYIQLDIGNGIITFNGKDCVATIPVNKMYFVDTRNSVTNITLGASVKNYEIGKLYKGKISFGGWNNYITILSDDPANTVFVFGFSKE